MPKHMVRPLMSCPVVVMPIPIGYGLHDVVCYANAAGIISAMITTTWRMVIDAINTNITQKNFVQNKFYSGFAASKRITCLGYCVWL